MLHEGSSSSWLTFHNMGFRKNLGTNVGSPHQKGYGSLGCIAGLPNMEIPDVLVRGWGSEMSDECFDVSSRECQYVGHATTSSRVRASVL